MTNTLLSELQRTVCYTELVYQRVNKKLKTQLTQTEIEALVDRLLADVTSSVEKRGKNYYITNQHAQIQLVINSFNSRLITVNALWPRN